jgi:chorismate mutase-like protein
MTPTNLNKLRSEIDALDEKLVELLNRRARCAQEIGRLKQQNGQAVFEPQREEAVMANVTRSNRGPLSHEDLVAIYTAILAAMRRLQSPDLLERQ